MASSTTLLVDLVILADVLVNVVMAQMIEAILLAAVVG